METPSFKKDKKNYTPEEYFELEAKASFKSEYHNGKIVAMAGGSIAHAHISGNTFYGLKTALKGRPCVPFNSDVKIAVARFNAYLYPDVSVVCGTVETPDDQLDRIQNPILIIAILSASTKDYDRVEKFRKYLTISSLREYVLIEQTTALVQSFYRNDDLNLWEISFVEKLSESLYFKSLNCELKMADIYENVVFEEDAD